MLSTSLVPAILFPAVYALVLVSLDDFSFVFACLSVLFLSLVSRVVQRGGALPVVLRQRQQSLRAGEGAIPRGPRDGRWIMWGCQRAASARAGTGRRLYLWCYDCRGGRDGRITALTLPRR